MHSSNNLLSCKHCKLKLIFMHSTLFRFNKNNFSYILYDGTLADHKTLRVTYWRKSSTTLYFPAKYFSPSFSFDQSRHANLYLDELWILPFLNFLSLHHWSLSNIVSPFGFLFKVGKCLFIVICIITLQ